MIGGYLSLVKEGFNLHCHKGSTIHLRDYTGYVVVDTTKRSTRGIAASTRWKGFSLPTLTVAITAGTYQC